MAAIVFVILLLGLGSVTTQQINWTRMFYSQLKIPYGTYALKEILPSMFNEVDRNRNTLLELTDTLAYPSNILSVSDKFDLTDRELGIMLDRARTGSNFLISANYVNAKLLDTLGLKIDTTNVFFGNQITTIMDEGEQADYRFSIKDFLIRDTVHILATDPSFDKDHFVIKKRDIFTYLAEIESDSIQVLATYHGNPVLIKVDYGEGDIVLSTTPHLLSNIYLIQGDNWPFVSYMMSYAGYGKLIWTEFYEIGRGLSSTPLRYILSQAALRFALYTALGGLLLLAIFEIKRKQRAIPVIHPLRNETLQFVETIGNLYFEGGHHHSIATKRAQFFLEYVRTNYFMETRDLNDQFIDTLAKKSHSDKELIKKLSDQINYIQKSPSVSDDLLKKFSENLDRFYHYNTKKTVNGKQ